MHYRSKQIMISGLLGLICLVSLIVISDTLRLRFDLTEEGRFTLSEASESY